MTDRPLRVTAWNEFVHERMSPHETIPIDYHPRVRRIIANGVAWAAPTGAP